MPRPPSFEPREPEKENSGPTSVPGPIPALTFRRFARLTSSGNHMRAVPKDIRALVPASREYRTLGTDGFGRRDTHAARCRFFGVDADSIARAVVAAG